MFQTAATGAVGEPITFSSDEEDLTLIEPSSEEVCSSRMTTKRERSWADLPHREQLQRTRVVSEEEAEMARIRAARLQRFEQPNEKA